MISSGSSFHGYQTANSGINKSNSLPPNTVNTATALESGGMYKTDDLTLTNKPLSSTLKKNREEEDMSFAGITFCDGKILAFADSKSTRYIDRISHDDGYVRKIFKADEFILVFTGTNTIPIMDGELTRLQKLEDWMDKNIPKASSPIHLLLKLQLYFDKYVTQDVGHLSVKGAYLNHTPNLPRYTVLDAEIGKNYFRYEKIPAIDSNSWFMGNSEYVEHFKWNSVELMTSSKEQLCFVLEDIVKKMQTKHGLEWYNPVGGPICVEEL